MLQRQLVADGLQLVGHRCGLARADHRDAERRPVPGHLDRVHAAKAGFYCFFASYGGDSNYQASSEDLSNKDQAALECFQVTPGPTSTTTQSSLTGSGVLGATGSVTDTATVTGNSAGGAPTGNVSFFWCYNASSSPTSCDASGNAVGTPSLTTGTPSADQSQATSTGFTPGKAGYYCFFASYGGDSNYQASSENLNGEGVAALECFQVTPGPTTTATQASVSSYDLSTDAGAVTDTATVTGNSAGGAPTGTVTFYQCFNASSSPTSCDATGTKLDTVGVTTGTPTADQSQAASAGFTPTQPGFYCFFASYGGDSNYLASSDTVTTSECFKVTQANFTVLKTDVPGNGNPVNPGSTIPYTVAIQNVGDGAGPATIKDTVPANLTVTGTPVCGTLTGSDTCVVSGSGNDWTFQVSLAAGDSVSVTFSAVVSATAKTDVVNTATITDGLCTTDTGCSSTVTNPVPFITVVKSANPASGTTVNFGQTITYTLAVSNSGSGDSGLVVVTDTIPTGTTYVAASASCGSVPHCTAAEASGVVTFTLTSVAAGASGLDLTFAVTVNAGTVGPVVNTASYTGAGCTVDGGGKPPVDGGGPVTCSTNTTTHPVTIPVAPGGGSNPAPPAPVQGATTVHTGSVWQSWGRIAFGSLMVGLALLLFGTALRRRRLYIA